MKTVTTEVRRDRHTQDSQVDGILSTFGSNNRFFFFDLVVLHLGDLKKLQNKLSNSVRQVPIERSKLLHRLYNKAAGNVQRRNDESEEAIIDEPCPKCAHPQLSFHTAQLRGVDEGQTVFYTCLNSKCAHKFTVNT